MEKLTKFFGVFLFTLLFIGVASIAEEITLTTYYPAPFGAYDALTATKLDVGATGLVVGGSYSGTETAPANGMLVEGSVGIGTDSPTVKLDVNGTINATGYSAGGTVGYNGSFQVSTPTGTLTITVSNGIITDAS